MRMLKTALAAILAAALLAAPAMAMTAEQAKQTVLDIDADAKNAKEFYVYPSADSYGAWVVYVTGWSIDRVLRTGAAWYVSAEGVCLGHSRAIFNWDFFTAEPVPAVLADKETTTDGFENRFRSHIEGDTEIFASNTQPGGESRVNAWIVTPEDRVVELDTGTLIALDACHGALYGLAAKNDLDYCFLCVDSGQLTQIAAAPIDEETVNGFYGGYDLLEELRNDGYEVTGFLYRFSDPLKDDGSADLPAAGGVITVNLERGGAPYHTYFYEEPRYGGLYATRGWEDEIAAFTGPGTVQRDAGLPVIQTEIG